jgi:hypothetical protein
MNDNEGLKTIQRALFLSGKAPEEVLNSIGAFRDFMVQVVKLAVPDSVAILVGASTIRVTIPGSDAVRTFSLARKFGQIDPSEPISRLSVYVSNIVSTMGDTPSPDELGIGNSLSNIVPLLKSSEYAVGNAQHLRQEAIQSGRDPASEVKLSWEVNSQITAYPVVNRVGSYQFITMDQLQVSLLEEHEVKDIALQNVRDVYSTLPSSDYSQGSSEFSGVDGFASALILLPEFLEREYKAAGGSLCILSGDADHLFLVPMANTRFLDFVLGKVATGALPLPEIPPLVYHDGRLDVAMIQEVGSGPSFSI